MEKKPIKWVDIFKKNIYIIKKPYWLNQIKMILQKIMMVAKMIWTYNPSSDGFRRILKRKSTRFPDWIDPLKSYVFLTMIIWTYIQKFYWPMLLFIYFYIQNKNSTLA